MPLCKYGRYFRHRRDLFIVKVVKYKDSHTTVVESPGFDKEYEWMLDVDTIEKCYDEVSAEEYMIHCMSR